MGMIQHGDALDILRTMPTSSVDSIVTDPPYGLDFMGKSWDKTLPNPEIWVQCRRVLKPGGHMVAFGAPRLYHRLGCQIEDAGFELRDLLMWLFGCLSDDTETPGSRVRMTGDGPACWTCPIVQSRPSCIPYSKWGALPGSYVFTSDQGAHGGNEGDVVGAKPLALGLALIDDYTSEGDVVFDPTTGGGTFVLAAAMRGRLGVGCERDPATFELALARLRRGYTASLFSAPARMEQTGLSFPVEPEPAYEPIDREPERPEYTDDELCAIEMVSRMEARA